MSGTHSLRVIPIILTLEVRQSPIVDFAFVAWAGETGLGGAKAGDGEGVVVTG